MPLQGEEGSSLISYTVKQSLMWLKSRVYRNDVLRCLVELYSHMPQPDYINMCQVNPSDFRQTSMVSFGVMEYCLILVFDFLGRSDYSSGHFGEIDQER